MSKKLSWVRFLPTLHKSFLIITIIIINFRGGHWSGQHRPITSPLKVRLVAHYVSDGPVNFILGAHRHEPA